MSGHGNSRAIVGIPKKTAKTELPMSVYQALCSLNQQALPKSEILLAS
jgi:hypothetical protein